MVTRLVKSAKAQMKIQQMAFMIIAVFIFFALVAIFFLSWQTRSLKNDFGAMQKEQAISSIAVISDMPELNCDSKISLCLDEDKIKVMASNYSQKYEDFWPVASVKVYRVYPKDQFEQIVVFDSGQTNIQEYSTFVSICKKLKSYGYVYDQCDIGKLSVGVKIPETTK